METQDLSSNWKRLKQSLEQKSSATPLKRKASNEVANPQASSHRKVQSIRNTSHTSLKQSSVGVIVSKSSQTDSLITWAAENDISRSSLQQAYGTSSTSSPSSAFTLHHPSDSPNAGLNASVPAGKYIAIDCEMVGVGPNPADESALARVSVVDYHGVQLYDSFVLPKEAVTDYRTAVSGITPRLLRSARTLEEVQRDVAKLMDGRIVIGHSMRHDLNALMLGHPRRDLRDTSRYQPFRQFAAGRTPSLKKLAEMVLGVQVQSGQHSSVEDARVAMGLYRREKAGFEEVYGSRGRTKRMAVGRGGGNVEDKTSLRRKKKKKKKKKTKK